MTCPYVLGHEGAGVIVWIGSKAQGLGIGDRVAIEPGVPCGQCFQCSAGSYHLCHSVEFSGALPHHGSMRRFHVHPGRYLQKLPDNLSFADGALLEPLSVVMHGFERSPVQLGKLLTLTSFENLGMLTRPRRSNSHLWCWSDRSDRVGSCTCIRCLSHCHYRHRSRPTRFRGDICPRKHPDSRSAGQDSRADGFDHHRETWWITSVGGLRVHRCREQCHHGLLCPATRRSSHGDWRVEAEDGWDTVHANFFMEGGFPTHLPSIGNVFAYMSFQIDLKFINRYYHCWPLVISAVEHGILDLKPLVTHTFGLEEADKALRTAADRTSGSVKVHVVD